jgi:hypothetical protein
MVRIHRTLKAVALGMAIISSSAIAQSGSSASLVHTVSVTVPPRVKIQVRSAQSIGSFGGGASANSTTQGIAVSIAATRSWVLSSGNVTVASGGLASDPRSAEVMLNTSRAASASRADSARPPVVLTISAP